MHDKPCSPACERNREPILAVLREHFAARGNVLEIGSGTGQHAVHFAAAMPWLRWQCSDRAGYLPGIDQWLHEAALANTPAAVEFDVTRGPWPLPADPRGDRFDAAFSANTLHIMAWAEVEALFAGLGTVLDDDATVVVYGPFNRDGDYSSDSNRRFDASLKARAPHMGIRDVEAVHALARSIALRPVADVAMPANNRILVWRRG